MLKIINPSNASVITELEEDTAGSLRQKYSLAVAAFEQLKNTTFEERAQWMGQFAKLLVNNTDTLAKTLTEEMGKPLSQAKGEIGATIDRIQYFIDNTAGLLKPQKVAKGDNEKLDEWMTNEPLGVVANISAWNYPYFVGTNVFVPAILTGNCVLYKPSEYATMTGLAIAKLLTEAGVPAGVFQTIVGGGSLGAQLLDLPVDGVFFTGSHATGVKISQAVAPKLIRLQLELGGKDPSYVCEDADPIAAAEALADGAFYNTGQSCCSVERIYVHEKLFSIFLDHFQKIVQGFKIGNPLAADTYIGPLTREAHLAYLSDQIKDAQSKGAEVLCGGGAIEGPGFYFQPTLLANVNCSMDVMKEESFGPIIGVQAVKNDESAIEVMNNTQYGLTAGVYTASKERAKTLARQLAAGTVYWNACDRVSPRLPWTGWKNSGIGSTLSKIGIQSFLQPKSWNFTQ